MTVTIESGSVLAAPLDDLKAYLRITTSDEDPLLTDLIRAATDVGERFTGQLVIVRGVEEVLSAKYGWLRLAMRPVTGITAVASVGIDGSEAALALDAYAIDIDGNGDGWIKLADTSLAEDASARIHVSYSAGIAADSGGVPDAIRHGIVRLAGDYYGLREGVDAHPPASVAALWRPWRRMHLK